MDILLRRNKKPLEILESNKWDLKNLTPRQQELLDEMRKAHEKPRTLKDRAMAMREGNKPTYYQIS
jgi:hypothetical protein